MKVENKVFVVTGGGSGMGRELALNLLSKGAKVVAIDINEAGLQETTALSGDKKNFLTTFIMDITSKLSVEELLNQILTLHGCVDGIINNAGIIQPFVKLNELKYNIIERVINVNLYGVLYMTKTFLPHLLTRPEAHIVNISSMGGFLPVPGQSIYGASKAAVKLLTEGLQSELADTNVKVSVVFPGAVNTNIMSNSGLSNISTSEKEQNAHKILTAAKAAEMIIEGMERDHYRIFVGKDAKFMDLLYRLHPRSAAKLIYTKMRDKLLNV
jgi:short-subunit dehydrogenase